LWFFFAPTITEPLSPIGSFWEVNGPEKVKGEYPFANLMHGFWFFRKEQQLVLTNFGALGVRLAAKEVFRSASMGVL
jgi:hypothetical protein